MTVEEVRNRLSEKGLKVTPQRINILQAVYELNNHPTAENVLDFVRESNPNIAKGTIYNVLETLVRNKLIQKVKTDKDILRYDGIIENHHHLYCTECDFIEDYVNKELDDLLKEYFKKNKLKGFEIENIVLQIRGTSDKC